MEDASIGYRERLLDRMVLAGAVESRELMEAVRAVPLHRLLCGLYYRDETGRLVGEKYSQEKPTHGQLEAIYNGEPLPTSVENGQVHTWQPSALILARMIEVSHIAAGMNVLQLGHGGSAYMSALLAELVGPTGSVTVVDDDVEALDRLGFPPSGYTNVRIVHMDPALMHTPTTRFDRIVVASGCFDISEYWTQWIAPTGLMTIPLYHGGWFSVMCLRPGDAALRGRIMASGGAALPPIISAVCGTADGTGPFLVDEAGARTYDVDADLQSGELMNFLCYVCLRHPHARGIGLVDSSRRIKKGVGIVTEEDWVALRSGTYKVVGTTKGIEILADLKEQWVSQGRPRLTDYRVDFLPICGSETPKNGADSWTIHRSRHAEVVHIDQSERRPAELGKVRKGGSWWQR